MKYLETFQQTPTRAWIWFALMMLSIVFTFVSIYHADWRAAVDNFFFAITVYWVDQLEKYITKKNKETK